MGFVGLIFLGLGCIFWLTQFLDLMARKDSEFRGHNDKVIWGMLLIFTSFIGAILWFLFKPYKIPSEK